MNVPPASNMHFGSVLCLAGLLAGGWPSTGHASGQVIQEDHVQIRGDHPEEQLGQRLAETIQPERVAPAGIMLHFSTQGALPPGFNFSAVRMGFDPRGTLLGDDERLLGLDFFRANPDLTAPNLAAELSRQPDALGLVFITIEGKGDLLFLHWQLWALQPLRRVEQGNWIVSMDFSPLPPHVPDPNERRGLEPEISHALRGIQVYLDRTNTFIEDRLSDYTPYGDTDSDECLGSAQADTRAVEEEIQQILSASEAIEPGRIETPSLAAVAARRNARTCARMRGLSPGVILLAYREAGGWAPSAQAAAGNALVNTGTPDHPAGLPAGLSASTPDQAAAGLRIGAGANYLEQPYSGLEDYPGSTAVWLRPTLAKVTEQDLDHRAWFYLVGNVSYVLADLNEWHGDQFAFHDLVLQGAHFEAPRPLAVDFEGSLESRRQPDPSGYFTADPLQQQNAAISLRFAQATWSRVTFHQSLGLRVQAPDLVGQKPALPAQGSLGADITVPTGRVTQLTFEVLGARWGNLGSDLPQGSPYTVRVAQNWRDVLGQVQVTPPAWHWRALLRWEGHPWKPFSISTSLGYGETRFSAEPLAGLTAAWSDLPIAGWPDGLLGSALLAFSPTPAHRLEAGVQRDIEDCWYANAITWNHWWAGYRFRASDLFSAQLEGGQRWEHVYGLHARDDQRWEAGLSLALAPFNSLAFALAMHRGLTQSSNQTGELPGVDQDYLSLQFFLETLL